MKGDIEYSHYDGEHGEPTPSIVLFHLKQEVIKVIK
jgi:hypothetical protein